MARGVWVSGNFYQMLGIRPLIGRTLNAADDQTAGAGGPDGAVAVISGAYWQQRFGGDPAIIGRTIYLYGRPVTIVGVMPTGTMSLEPGRPIDIAAPMVLSDAARLRDRRALWLFAVARLKSTGSVAQAAAESEALFNAYMVDAQIAPETRKRLFARIDLAPAGKGFNSLRNQFSKPLTALMILAGLVLLAACVNLTNLMLARAMARQKEFAVRLAIGAGRGRLIRQNLTESLVLVGAGAALGIVLAGFGKTALMSFFAAGNDGIVLDVSMNLRVLIFTLGLALLSGLALGIGPAMRAARLDPAAGMQGGSRNISGDRVFMKLGRALVTAQVALSMILLTGAALFIRSLRQLESVDAGFARGGILTMEVVPPRDLAASSEWLAAQTEIVEQIRRISGVYSAGWTTANPLTPRGRAAVIEVPGFVPVTDSDRDIHLASVSPEYFETLGAPILLGRGFSVRDRSNAPKVAILNETAARFYFGHSSPIGRTVRFTNYPSRDLLYQVVGVVKDIRYNLREPAARRIYLPIPQYVEPIRQLALAVRCSGNATTFAAPIRGQIHSVRPTLVIENIFTMEHLVDRGVFQERLVATLSTAFGFVAMLLAGIGLYGILTYAVTRRTNEIGIRMALGATKGEVVWMVLREAYALCLAGIVIAVPVVLTAGRVAGSLLYGVAPLDPVSFASATLLLLVFAALAAVMPGRRASLLDPSAALRRD
jgi:predicted permease